MSWDLLDGLYRNGVGQGWGYRYIPFNRLRRRNPSPVSNQVAGALLPDIRRDCCFLARIEWLLSLLCFWLHAVDVWEQFPCWPFEHEHPLSRLPSWHLRSFPHSRGVWEIAHDAGIDHGNYVNSDVPFPVTSDLLVAFGTPAGLACAAIPIKAASIFRDAEPRSRVRERLELERRYHVELGNYLPGVTTESMMTETLAGQLVMYSAATALPAKMGDPMRIVEFANRIDDLALKETIDGSVARVCAKMHLALSDGHAAFNHCVWKRLIDIDITEPIIRSYPIRRGGERIASALRAQLFGPES